MRPFNALLLCLLAIFTVPLSADHTAAPGGEAQEPSVEFEVGVWLNRIIMQRGEEAIVEFIDQAAALGATSILPNYWFHGYVIYPDSKFAGQHPDFDGWDPMAIVVRESRKHGLKVYPWLEYGFFTHFNRGGVQPPDDEDIGYILAARPEMITVNKQGRRGLHNAGMGVTHYSLNPGHPDAREFLAAVALEVIEKYPEIAGVHLDRIRYQGADWSYDDYSRAKFREEAGIDPMEIPEGDLELNARWKRWREDQVNEFMGVFAAKLRAAYPDKLITAAVVPPYMKEEKYQRWEEWVRAGTLDVVVPMVYGDAALVRREVQQCMEILPENSMLWAGIDAGAPIEQVNASIRAAKELGARGVVIWNDEQFVAKKIKACEALAPAAQPETAPTSQPAKERPDLY